jgi:glycosyltransferase involved in cell wall biosynthesis
MPFEFQKLPQRGVVSIIIPCYNSERFLPETLESAFAQSYPHTEILVIDDGSTDRTAELLLSYAGRLRADFGPNRGASSARNRGTALAKGEFIQYLDADDLLTPDAIASRVSSLRETGADVAYSDWEKLVETAAGVFEMGELIARRAEQVHPTLEIALITEFWAPPAAVTYRRTIVDKIGGWKEWLPVIQDARFLQDACLFGGRFTYVPGIGARYRVHLGASLSRRSDAHFVSDVFRNACDLQAIFEAKGMMNGEGRHAFARILDYVARSLFYQDKSAFRDCMARLNGLDPGFRISWPKVADLGSKTIGFGATNVLLSLMSKLRHAQRKLS